MGLDTDIDRIPAHLLDEEDPLFAFNKAIVDATLPYAVAYKPNTAFYEACGAKGWTSLQKTIAYIGHRAFVIADAKRGDIGNTSHQYARAIFDHLGADAITLSPYMGSDTVMPFLEYKDKWAVVLALTSNKSASELEIPDDLYLKVIRLFNQLGTPENTMYVVGATQIDYIQKIRTAAPDHFFLVPGVGAQGGDLQEVVRFGINKDVGLLINSSRSIIYASGDKDYATAAGESARQIASVMSSLLTTYA